MTDYTLRLFTPVYVDWFALGMSATSRAPKFVADITPDPLRNGYYMKAQGWKRTIRRLGGYFQGEFSLYGEIDQLTKWFYTYLGYHLVETSGGQTTWEGMVYEMELSYGGSSRRRSLDAMYNNAHTVYTDAKGDPQQTTAAQDANSITHYGKREMILSLDGADAAAGTARRDAFFAENAWPWARTVGAGIGGDSKLTITCQGYIATANWQYIPDALLTGGTVTAGAWVNTIGTACWPYLNIGNVQPNGLAQVQQYNVPTRAWDAVAEITDLGGTVAGQEVWRAYVDNDRRFYYEPIDTAPRYYWTRGALHASAGDNVEVNPWQVRPAVVRDLDFPIKSTELGAWLSDARDFYADEVTVSADNGLTMTTGLYDEAQILADQQDYAAQAENAQTGAASGGGHGTLNWKRRAGLVEGSPEWNAAVAGGWKARSAYFAAKKAKKKKKRK